MADGAAPPASETAPGSTQGRVIVALVAGQLGLHAVMAGLRMAAPLQTLREGYSAWSVGLLLALFAAAPVVLALHAGRLADRLGYHRPVYLGVGLAVLGAALAVLSTFLRGYPHFVLLCLGGALTGAGANLGMLTIQRTGGLIARNSTERLRIFSWLGVAPAFANVIGPVAAGFMIDAQGFRAAYGLLLLLPLATLISARYVPRLPHAPQRPKEATQPHAEGARARTSWDLLQVPGFKRLLVVNWLFSTCWDVHTFAVPVLGHERGFSASTIGLILGSFTLAVTAVRLVIPTLAHRLKETTVLRSAMVATCCIFVLYPLAPSPLLMGACALMLGVSLGCVQPVVMSMLHHLTPDQRHGEALAFRSMAINASSSVMPLVFGATGLVAGATLLFWAVGGAVGAGNWLVAGLRGTRATESAA
jgi:MFS family permease